MNEMHLEDFKKFNRLDQYMERYFIGHYTPLRIIFLPTQSKIKLWICLIRNRFYQRKGKLIGLETIQTRKNKTAYF